MQQHIAWCVELTFEPAHLAACRALAAEMASFSRDEPNTLIYERFLAEAPGVMHLYERYRDCASAVAHLRAFDARFGDRFHRLVRRRRFVVFGRPTQELKALLDRFGATYSHPLAGFARC